MNELMQAVSTVGFPIVMSVILMKFIQSMSDHHREDLKEMTQTVNNNTLILQKLIDKLDQHD